jgi:hypothetical protein
MEKTMSDEPVEVTEPVEIVEEPAKEQEIEQVAQEVAPEAGIEELKRKLANEQAARLEAERRAQQANSQVRKAYGEVEDTNYHLVVNAIDTVKGRAEALKAAYREAMSVGDYDKVAELQEAMSINAVQHSELEKGRAAMENRIRQMQAEAAAPQPRSGDPIEQLAESVSPRSAAWLRRNRELVQDQRSMKKMFRAHEDAVDEGIEPDSDAYFTFIEGRMGARPREEAVDNPLSAAAAPATPRRSTPPASAPVTRSGTGAGGRPGTATLSRDEKEMAQMLGMSDSEYYIHKTALKKEGRIQ